MGHPAPSREGVRRSNHGRSFDRRDVWVGLKPTDRLRANRSRQGREERQLRKRKTKTLLSEWRSLLKKCLTGPTLLRVDATLVRSPFGGALEAKSVRGRRYKENPVLIRSN